MKNWPVPQNTYELRSFLGLVKSFADLTHPLNQLLTKGTPFRDSWQAGCRNCNNMTSPLFTELVNCIVMQMHYRVILVLQPTVNIARKLKVQSFLEILAPDCRWFPDFAMARWGVGHFGVTKMLKQVKQRFYWHQMRTDVKRWCEKCDMCSSRKGPVRKPRAPLKLYMVGAPMERIAMDIMGPLPTTRQGNKYLLVAMDYFTKWPEESGSYHCGICLGERVHFKIWNTIRVAYGSGTQLWIPVDERSLQDTWHP